MSENDFHQIKDGLNAVQATVNDLKSDMAQVKRCLLGDLSTGGFGLMAEHHACMTERDKCGKRLEAVEEKVESLSTYKREVVSWVSGAMAVVFLGYEAVKTYFGK